MTYSTVKTFYKTSWRGTLSYLGQTVRRIECNLDGVYTLYYDDGSREVVPDNAPLALTPGARRKVAS